MVVSEKAEEILEALWIVHEEEKCAVIKLSQLRIMPDISTLKELIDAQIIEQTVDKEFRLTEKGLILARDAIRRHRLAERLLTDILAVKKELVHETACGFEHHLHKGVDASVCTLLGHPRFCPHGRPIPPGSCCKEQQRVVEPAVYPLSMMKPQMRGYVIYLSTTDPKTAQMLISMGVVPGVEITLLAGYPSYLFQIGEGQFAVDKNIASQIYIRVEKM